MSDDWFEAPGLGSIAALLEADGWIVVVIDGERIDGKGALLAELARQMAFPDYFGGNWDALQDCLTDLSWLPAAGYLVILQAMEALRNRHPDDLATACEILAAAVDRWRGTQTPFLVLFA